MQFNVYIIATSPMLNYKLQDFSIENLKFKYLIYKIFINLLDNAIKGYLLSYLAITCSILSCFLHAIDQGIYKSY